MSAFEIIDEEEFEKTQAPVPEYSVPFTAEDEDGVDTRIAKGVSAQEPEQLPLFYCKFCNGYYIYEYHYGEEGGENTDDN